MSKSKNNSHVSFGSLTPIFNPHHIKLSKVTSFSYKKKQYQKSIITFEDSCSKYPDPLYRTILFKPTQSSNLIPHFHIQFQENDCKKHSALYPKGCYKIQFGIIGVSKTKLNKIQQQPQNLKTVTKSRNKTENKLITNSIHSILNNILNNHCTKSKTFQMSDFATDGAKRKIITVLNGKYNVKFDKNDLQCYCLQFSYSIKSDSAGNLNSSNNCNGICTVFKNNTKLEIYSNRYSYKSNKLGKTHLWQYKFDNKDIIGIKYNSKTDSIAFIKYPSPANVKDGYSSVIIGSRSNFFQPSFEKEFAKIFDQREHTIQIDSEKFEYVYGLTSIACNCKNNGTNLSGKIKFGVFYKMGLISWGIIRLIWIGFYKNDKNKLCLLSNNNEKFQMNKDVLLNIISFLVDVNAMEKKYNKQIKKKKKAKEIDMYVDYIMNGLDDAGDPQDEPDWQPPAWENGQ